MNTLTWLWPQATTKSRQTCLDMLDRSRRKFDPTAHAGGPRELAVMAQMDADDKAAFERLKARGLAFVNAYEGLASCFVPLARMDLANQRPLRLNDR